MHLQFNSFYILTFVQVIRGLPGELGPKGIQGSKVRCISMCRCYLYREGKCRNSVQNLYTLLSFFLGSFLLVVSFGQKQCTPCAWYMMVPSCYEGLVLLAHAANFPSESSRASYRATTGCTMDLPRATALRLEFESPKYVSWLQPSLGKFFLEFFFAKMLCV